MPLAPAFFVGWLGYGTAFNSLELVEPTDSAYGRRPILYGPLDGCAAADVSAGSIGPAEVAWVGLSFVGLYDAVSSGNLLATMPLSPPRTVPSGMTLTDFRRFGLSVSFPGSLSSLTSSWVAGAELGRNDSGSAVIACCNLQVSGGVLSAIGAPPSTLMLSSLPSVAPAVGSGLLWNNGGVICIA